MQAGAPPPPHPLAASLAAQVMTAAAPNRKRKVETSSDPCWSEQNKTAVAATVLDALQ